MVFRRASDYAKLSARAARLTTSTGTPSLKRDRTTAPAKTGTRACPDCAGHAPNPACARCEGEGIVCARCGSAGFVYRAAADGSTRAFECACGKAASRRLAVLWPLLEQYSSLRGDLLVKSFDGFRLRPGFPAVREALDAARAYARAPRGWLILSGPPGVGKTHLAAAIANDLIARHEHPVLFLNVPELLGFLRAGFHAERRTDGDFETRLETIKTFPVLILDDWGAHSDTPWADEQLYLILNYRLERALPTIVSSNLPLEDFEPRIRSRLLNRHLSHVVELLAADYRLSD